MLIVLKSGSLNLLEPSGPVQACNGIALWMCLSNTIKFGILFCQAPITCVCTWESISSDFLQVSYKCWKQMKHCVGAIDLKLIIMQKKQWWFEKMDTGLGKSSYDNITLFTSRGYLTNWPTDWMTDQPADLHNGWTASGLINWLIDLHKLLTEQTTNWMANQSTDQPNKLMAD